MQVRSVRWCVHDHIWLLLLNRSFQWGIISFSCFPCLQAVSWPTFLKINQNAVLKCCPNNEDITSWKFTSTMLQQILKIIFLWIWQFCQKFRNFIMTFHIASSSNYMKFEGVIKARELDILEMVPHWVDKCVQINLGKLRVALPFGCF